MTQINHTSTRKVVCPYCGFELEDDGEWHDVKKWQCEDCNHTFSISIDYDVWFSTTRSLEPLSGEGVEQ